MELMYYEDFEVGQSFTSETYEVEKNEIVEYAKKWDPQPFHVDEEAAKASIFGGLTAPTAYVWAVVSWLGNTIEPKGAFLSALGTTDVEFPNPIRPDDRIILKTTVTQKRASRTKQDRGIVHFSTKVLNQLDETICSYQTKVMMSRQNKH